MRIIHTGDWHLGKLVHGLHMTEDQVFALDRLIELIAEEKPDVLLISGDIYDRAIPPVEAINLLNSVLSRILLEYHCKIIIIAGNHDNPERLAFGNQILRNQGLFICGDLQFPFEPIVLEDAFGPVHFYPLPYLDPVLIRMILDDQRVVDHDSATKAVLERIKPQLIAGQRHICLAHGFVVGSSVLARSDSERMLSVGGSEAVQAEYFADFDYVALGHLHQPQNVTAKIRYAGSLLKYSFSEAYQHKSVTILDLDANGLAELRSFELSVQHDMRIVTDSIANLLTAERVLSEDYIAVKLTDKGEIIDAMSRLRAVYPNILHIEQIEREREAGEDQSSANVDSLEKQPLELFKEFYENVSGDCFDKVKLEGVRTILEGLMRERREK